MGMGAARCIGSWFKNVYDSTPANAEAFKSRHTERVMARCFEKGALRVRVGRNRILIGRTVGENSFSELDTSQGNVINLIQGGTMGPGYDTYHYVTYDPTRLSWVYVGE